MDSKPGLVDRMLMTSIARRFYLDARSKSEIATEFGISRFRVARLLESALKEGIVRIEFDQPSGEIDFELSDAIKRRFGLRNALVVDDHEGDTAVVLDSMGRVAAELLLEISGPAEVLGFTWTRVMEAMTPHLAPLRARAIVQLGGAWPGAGVDRTSVDLVRDLARLSSGQAYTFYAPLLASDVPAAEAIRRQPDVLAARAMFAKVTLAIVGLGAWRAGGSSLWPALTSAQRAGVARQGAVAEICGMTMDRHGQPVDTELARLSVGIGVPDLVACPDVLALAFGVEKIEAILATIRGGVVKSLVTHVAVARAMLDAEP